MPALRAWWAWVGACGPVGGSRAMRCVARGFWRVDAQFSDRGNLARRGKRATLSKMGDYPLNARLGPGSQSEGDCRR